MIHDQLPKLALSVGEPAGIGPDIIANLAIRALPTRLLCIADPQVIAERAETLGIPLEIIECTEIDAAPPHRSGALAVLPVRANVPVVPGRLDTNNASYVLKCLDLAVSAAREGAVDAIVTGPVHKGVINDAGYPFTGHTEYLAKDLASKCEPVMMLVAGDLRVALATTHIALRDVPQALTSDRLESVISVVAQALKSQFNIRHPRIGVCGLNPHAGESGHFGHEDRDVIAPAMTAAARSDITLLGPMPADTAFAPSVRGSIDAYVTMYHDQGLPVIKALGFGEIVNITLGLPILRTSVDHGTAIELAGSGKAKCDSLFAAVNTAIRLAKTTRQ
jgi:4-hydroxythreonine-4-phosphate dehydrogenase